MAVTIFWHVHVLGRLMRGCWFWIEVAGWCTDVVVVLQGSLLEALFQDLRLAFMEVEHTLPEQTIRPREPAEMLANGATYSYIRHTMSASNPRRRAL